MKAIADFGTVPGMNGANTMVLLQAVHSFYRSSEEHAILASDSMVTVLDSTSAHNSICSRAYHLTFDIFC